MLSSIFCVAIAAVPRAPIAFDPTSVAAVRVSGPGLAHVEGYGRRGLHWQLRTSMPAEEVELHLRDEGFVPSWPGFRRDRNGVEVDVRFWSELSGVPLWDPLAPLTPARQSAPMTAVVVTERPTDRRTAQSWPPMGRQPLDLHPPEWARPLVPLEGRVAARRWVDQTSSTETRSFESIETLVHGQRAAWVERAAVRLGSAQLWRLDDGGVALKPPGATGSFAARDEPGRPGWTRVTVTWPIPNPPARWYSARR